MNTSKPDFRLIIGLGNPGKEYENTYHNVGHLFIDYLERQAASGKRHVSLTILHSTTYMNESGRFVAKAMRKSLPAGRQAAIKPEELLIAHDDSDIYLGNYKLSFGRGAAGHHGIESVIKSLGTKLFWRLRIGVRPISPISPIGLMKPKGRALAPRMKAGEFVLKKINANNKKILNSIFEKAATEIIRTP